MAKETDADVHPDIEPLSFLLGMWRGQGAGEYPTVDRFEYLEETRIWHVGRPVLFYMQRTWSPRNDAPMHSEMGYWRLSEAGGVEVVLAHTFGIAEVQEGTLSGTRVDLKSVTLVPTSTAKKVEALARVFQVDGDILTYTVDMAFEGHELQPHLRAELKRVT